MDVIEQLIDASSAARALGITTTRLYELSRRGLVPTVRVGRQVRFSPRALTKFIDDGGAGWAGGWRRDPSETLSTTPELAASAVGDATRQGRRRRSQ